MNWTLAATFVTACIGIAGCTRSEKFDQRYHENFFASIIARTLEFADGIAENRLVLTNLLILTNHVRIEVLVDYENKFLRYGRESGLTNSLFEKYIVLPQGVKSPPPDDGEIVLIGSRPMSKKNGKIERIFVAKHAKLGNTFGVDWIEEEKFQQALRDAGIESSQIQTPSSLPSMRQLYDPDGKIAATRKMISEEGAKDVENYEREHPMPLLQNSRMKFMGMAFLTMVAGALLWWFGRKS